MAATLTHTIAFRLTPSEYLGLKPFFEAFDGGASEGFRWLLSQPDVADLILRKAQEATQPC